MQRRLGSSPAPPQAGGADPLAAPPLPEACEKLPELFPRQVCGGRRRVGQARWVKNAWLERLTFGPTPVEDRLIQLWLGIFPVHWHRLGRPLLLLDQIAAIRGQLSGTYADLLGAMVANAAVQLSLNGLQSQRAKPNENLGRELLELFSLGRGTYTETDVIEASRALTGYRLRPDGSLVIDPRRHDDGEKRILGRRERFDGPSLVTWLCQQPATARHITARVWVRLVGPLPPPARIDTIATDWRLRQLSLPWLIQALLQSPEAIASMRTGGMLRDPIDVVIASLALLGSRHPEAFSSANASMARMGQGLFEAPTVKGWPVDREWLNLRWLQARRSGLQALLANEEIWASRAIGDNLPASLTPIPPLSLRLPTDTSRAQVAALFADPVWQLK